MDQLKVYKKNPIIIVGSFIALQFAVAGFYFFAQSIAYYAHIWSTLPILQNIDFTIAQSAIIFVLEIALIFYMFFSWYRQTIRLTPDMLIFDRGIMMRTHTIVPMSRIATATFRQSILGRLTHYGLVEICDAHGSSLLRLDGMNDPQEFIDEIIRRKSHLAVDADIDPVELLKMPEHERLERKSTFRWDINTNSVNKALEKAAMKTVAAFMNTQGGHLLLGVGDHGNAIGLESDYASLPKRDADGLENHFTNILSSSMGPSLRQYVRMQPFTHDGKECMLVSVSASDRPAYLKENDHEEFFIRTGNGTTALRMSEANAYITNRFNAKQ